jgi:hypothetical protein
MIRWFCLIWCCSTASLLVLESCASVKTTDSKTKIIQEVEAPLDRDQSKMPQFSLFTPGLKSIRIWRINNKQCGQVKKTATWGDSTEGRVCEAASEIAIRYYEP